MSLVTRSSLYALIAKSDWPSSSIASFVHGH